MGLKVMIFAGEVSGEMYGGLLARALRGSRPDIHMSGVGGDSMAGAGVDLVAHIRDLSVMGLWEVIRDYRRLREILNRARDHLRGDPPDAVVLVDFYRFNIELAREAKRLGVPVFYYVAPKLWVWGARRIHTLRKYVDRILAIFPFEEEFYASRGMPVTYVGNPLMDLLEEEDPGPLESSLDLNPGDTVISLLPGSRPSEVNYLLPVFLAASRLVEKELEGNVRFLMPLAHTIPRSVVNGMTSGASIPLTLIEGRSRQVLRASDAAIVASGTATLEAFLLGIPQVVAYRTSWLNYFLGSRIIKVPRVSLPNILTGRDVVDELLQENLTPESLARSLLELFRDEERKKEYRQAGEEALRSLRGQEASGLAARAILDTLKSGSEGMPA